MNKQLRVTGWLVLAALPAFAENDTRVMAALANASEQLAPKVTAVLAQQQRSIAPRCPLGPLAADEVVVLEMPAFNLDGMPERGDWLVRYRAPACKENVVRTAVFHAAATGVEVATSAPGTTRADGKLAEDVWASFQKAAVRAKPGCTAMVLRDTRVVEEPSGPTAIWREAWMAHVCGTDMGQVVSFYPTPKGALFRMSLPSEPLPEAETKPVYVPVN